MTEPPQTFKSFVTALNEKLKKEQKLKKDVVFSGDHGFDVPGWIPTGSSLLDWSIGRGLPLGRICEIFGHESSGKSTIALNAMANAQKMGGLAIFINSESTLDINRGKIVGLDPSKLIVLDSHTVEGGFSHLMATANLMQDYEEMKERPILVVWDTIASAPTAAELGGDGLSNGMMNRPRIIREKLRAFTKPISRMKICLLFVNQTISGPGGTGTGTGGGIKFHASARIQLTVPAGDDGKIIEGGRALGIMTEAYLIKNKLQRPLLRAKVPIRYSTGLDDSLALLHFLQNHKHPLVGTSGAWNQFFHPQKGKLSFYMKDLGDLVTDHPDIPGLLKDAGWEVWQKLYSSGSLWNGDEVVDPKEQGEGD